MNSYKPISLLPIFGKILEKIIQNSLMSIIERKRLIPDQQFSLRQQHSRSEKIHTVVEVATNALKNKMFS